MKTIKVFTDEGTVHTQLEAVEAILCRPVEFDISLNKKGVQSNIQFQADEGEISLIKDRLGYNILVLSGGHWLPSL